MRFITKAYCLNLKERSGTRANQGCAVWLARWAGPVNPQRTPQGKALICFLKDDFKDRKDHTMHYSVTSEVPGLEFKKLKEGLFIPESPPVLEGLLVAFHT